MWYATYLWAKEISKDLLRFGFLIFMVIGGQGCPHILVDLYWLGGLVFPSEFMKLTRLQNINFVSHICVDDSSMILLFPLHIFLVNNFQCKIV
jgi:hypothetical protein